MGALVGGGRSDNERREPVNQQLALKKRDNRGGFAKAHNSKTSCGHKGKSKGCMTATKKPKCCKRQ